MSKFEGHSSSELYAYSLGFHCEGREECYWCGCSCSQKWQHEEPPPIPFVRSTKLAKRPGNKYICAGCWLYRRKSITVFSLTNTLKDRQCLINHSWFMTEQETRVINKEDHDELFEYLLDPPYVFSLSLLSSSAKQSHIQLVPLNSFSEIHADTPLHFSYDGVTCSYTIYELEETIRTKETTGKNPGIRLLVDLLGYPLPKENEPQKKKRGRPPKKEEIDGKTVIRKIK